MGKRLKGLRIFLLGGDGRSLNSPTENMADPAVARKAKERKAKIKSLQNQHVDNKLDREEEIALRNLELDLGDRELDQDSKNKELEEPKDKWLEILKVIMPHVKPWIPGLLLKLGVTAPKDAKVVSEGVTAVNQEMKKDKDAGYIG